MMLSAEDSPHCVTAEGSLYVVKGVTVYPDCFENDPAAPEVFDNIWLVTLSEDGAATEFVEYWMQRD
jgi:hypothetical protein